MDSKRRGIGTAEGLVIVILLGGIVFIASYDHQTPVVQQFDEVSYSTGSHVCVKTTAAEQMIGLKLNFTTTGTGTIQIIIDFTVVRPASGASSYRLTYGTGNAPVCGHALTGTPTGDYHPVTSTGHGSDSEVAVDLLSVQLASGVKYWVDVAVNDSGTDTWTYQHGEMNVLEVG